MDSVDERWHLSKSVPISIVGFMLVQSVLLVIWGARLDFRVDALERDNLIHLRRIEAIETLREKLILIEERQNVVIKTLELNSRKLDALIEAGKARPAL